MNNYDYDSDYDYEGRTESYLYTKSISIDKDRKVLVVSFYRPQEGDREEQVKQEFPLLRYCTCKKCEELTKVYAKGTLNIIDKALGEDKLFPKPWKYAPWTMLKTTDGIAFIAKNGHRFSTDSRNKINPTCHHKEEIETTIEQAIPQIQTVSNEKAKPKDKAKDIEERIPIETIETKTIEITKPETHQQRITETVVEQPKQKTDKPLMDYDTELLNIFVGWTQFSIQ